MPIWYDWIDKKGIPKEVMRLETSRDPFFEVFKFSLNFQAQMFYSLFHNLYLHVFQHYLQHKFDQHHSDFLFPKKYSYLLHKVHPLPYGTTPYFQFFAGRILLQKLFLILLRMIRTNETS
ncbi:Uncharacterised protein [Mycobacteroides abscessus subsp. abscessus]|nr:Uncharacterised protein [Mycobacteroides abscessus subsp. abscessus]